LSEPSAAPSRRSEAIRSASPKRTPAGGSKTWSLSLSLGGGVAGTSAVLSAAAIERLRGELLHIAQG
jgi:hypothetical protein